MIKTILKNTKIINRRTELDTEQIHPSESQDDTPENT